MKDLRGKPFRENDAEIEKELTAAGIRFMDMNGFNSALDAEPEAFSEVDGVKTNIVNANLLYWQFYRARTYWIAKGPGLIFSDAVALWEASQKGGHCILALGDKKDPHPMLDCKDWGIHTYHITSLTGLVLFADTLKAAKERANSSAKIE